jgi:hypothetical protein
VPEGERPTCTEETKAAPAEETKAPPPKETKAAPPEEAKAAHRVKSKTVKSRRLPSWLRRVDLLLQGRQ